MIDIRQGDCLELMQTLQDKSVDMILNDPPYGTTACKWDSIIDLEKMWSEYKRVIKPNGAICIFGAQPFSSVLISSHLKGFKCEWVWLKNRGTGFQCAKYRPMMQTESIMVFTSKGERVNYNPQMIPLDRPVKYRYSSYTEHVPGVTKKGYYEVTHKHPTNVVKFDKVAKPIHPTEKPVELLEYFINTYSNEGDTILDNTMGSGSTGVACINTGRNFIGYELDKKIF